ncbi:MAG: hypothetical protein QG630_338 [Patescibacteria group bacterium]|nr:hypothetical protein [Patescibacteria group bacterium]
MKKIYIVIISVSLIILISIGCFLAFRKNINISNYFNFSKKDTQLIVNDDWRIIDFKETSQIDLDSNNKYIWMNPLGLIPKLILYKKTNNDSDFYKIEILGIPSQYNNNEKLPKIIYSEILSLKKEDGINISFNISGYNFILNKIYYPENTGSEKFETTIINTDSSYNVIKKKVFDNTYFNNFSPDRNFVEKNVCEYPTKLVHVCESSYVDLNRLEMSDEIIKGLINIQPIDYNYQLFITKKDGIYIGKNNGEVVQKLEIFKGDYCNYNLYKVDSYTFDFYDLKNSNNSKEYSILPANYGEQKPIIKSKAIDNKNNTIDGDNQISFCTQEAP